MKDTKQRDSADYYVCMSRLACFAFTWGSAVLINKVRGPSRKFFFFLSRSQRTCTQRHKHTAVLVKTRTHTGKHICDTDENEASKRRVGKLFTVSQA